MVESNTSPKERMQKHPNETHLSAAIYRGPQNPTCNVRRGTNGT